MRRVRIGLLGCGTVGGGFVALVSAERERLAARYGIDLEIGPILVRDITKRRAVDVAGALTTSALEVIDGEVDLIVEAIGGLHTAGALVRRAIARRLPVVTANKALLAAAGRELFAAADQQGVALGFEASVCGGVPVIGALRRGLAGDSIEQIGGVLNGTSNYVLCRMESGLSLGQAVTAAQAAGFAEADPALDIGGDDAAQKLAILAQLAFAVPLRRSVVTSIESLSAADFDRARAAGCVIRQVGEARSVAGGVELRVEPRLVPRDHPFGRAIDEQNVVAIRGRAVGDVVLTGRGAGAMPTAAAVLADVLEIARERMQDCRCADEDRRRRLAG